MDYHPQEVKAGLMITLSILILIVLLVAISGLDMLKPKKQYLARFNNTGGLEIGSVVRFGGMEVGQIKTMRICEQDNSKIEFVLKVGEHIPVKSNSVATVTSIGIMGEQHINITTGHPDSALLADGSLLSCQDVMPIMQLMEPLGEILDQMNGTLTALRQILGQENQAGIRSILLNLNQLLAENQQSVSLMLRNLNEGVIGFSQVSGKIDSLLNSNADPIRRSMMNLEETLAETKKMMRNMDRMMITFDESVLQKGENLEAIMDDLSQTAGNLEEFSRTIKERPWQLIRKSAPAERKIE